MRRCGSAGLLLVISMTLMSVTGCGLAPCDDVRRDYERAATSQSGLVALSDDGAPHLAMAIRLDLLNDLTSSLIDTAVGNALSIDGNLNVAGGQSVGYGLTGTGADLRLDASSACTACLRIRGGIDGSVRATLPVLGQRSSPLTGQIDWTVPLSVGLDDDGAIAVFIDTAEALRMGTPGIQARVDAFPSQWSNLIASALIPELADAVARHVDPIRLFGYKSPNLGINGLEMAPSLLVFDAASNAMILGVRTNLPVATSRSTGQDVVNALSLSEGQNIAMGVQPGAVLGAATLAMQQNRIARRYSLTGEARRDGPAHAVLDNFRASAHPRSADALALGLDFRLFNFGSGWACGAMTGNAVSRLLIQNGRVELDVESVEFSDSLLADAANWGSAQFIQHTQGVVRHTLNDDIVLSPGVGMSMSGDRVSTEAGMLVLRGIGRSSN